MCDSWSSKTDACEQLLKQSAVSSTLGADILLLGINFQHLMKTFTLVMIRRPIVNVCPKIKSSLLNRVNLTKQGVTKMLSKRLCHPEYNWSFIPPFFTNFICFAIVIEMQKLRWYEKK